MRIILPRPRLIHSIRQLRKVCLGTVPHSSSCLLDVIQRLWLRLILDRHLLPQLGLAARDVESRVLANRKLKIHERFVVTRWRVVGAGRSVLGLELSVARGEPGELCSVLKWVLPLIFELGLGWFRAYKLWQVIVAWPHRIHVLLECLHNLLRTGSMRDLVVDRVTWEHWGHKIALGVLELPSVLRGEHVVLGSLRRLTMNSLICLETNALI